MTVENGFIPGGDQKTTGESQKPVILGPNWHMFTEYFGDFISQDAYEHLRQRGVDIYGMLELRHRLMHVSAMQLKELDLDQITEMRNQIDQWKQDELHQEQLARELWHSGNRNLTDIVSNTEVLRGAGSRRGELMKLKVRALTESGYRVRLRDIQYVDGGKGNRPRQVAITKAHFERLKGSVLSFSPQLVMPHRNYVFRANYKQLPEEFTPSHYELLKYWVNYPSEEDKRSS